MDLPLQRMQVNAKGEMVTFPPFTQTADCQTRYPNDPEKKDPGTWKIPLISDTETEPFTCEKLNP